MDTFWIVAIVALGAWFFWPRAKPLTGGQTDSSIRDLGEHTPEDLEVARAKRARQKIEEDEQATIRQHHQSMEGARQKIARATAYLKETGLDRSIPDVWETVECWPSWVELPDQWSPPKGVSDIAGDDDIDVSWVSWAWQGRDYKIRFVRKTNYLPDDNDRLADMTLEVDSEAVCTIGCSKGLESYDSWRFWTVEALKVGPWMADFVSMAGYLRDDRDASTRRLFSESDQDRASRIDFGE